MATQSNYSRLGSGQWMNNYDDSIISDAQYQALQKSEMSPYFEYSAPILMGQDPNSGLDMHRVESTNKAPAPGQTAQSVVDEIMRNNSPQNAAGILGVLGNSGYLRQFPDGAAVEQQIGPWVAARLSERADSGDFMGMNGISQADVSVLSLLSPPFTAWAMGADAGAGAYGGFDNAAVAGADYGLGSAGSAAGGATVAPSGGANLPDAGTDLGMFNEAGNPYLNGPLSADSQAAINTAAQQGVQAGGGSVNTALQAGGAAAGATSLSRLLEGSGSATDWLDLAGRLAPSVLGAVASNRQANSFEDLANRYMEFGAPSRARYEASYAPGFSMNMDPGYKDALDQTTKSFLHKASVTGNPADSPNAWDQTLTDVNAKFAYPALQDYRRTNAGAGGLATFASAAPGMESNAIRAQGGVYDAIGAGAADIFSPPKTLTDLMRELRRSGYA